MKNPHHATRKLGVLGGMGPLASAHFMTRLTLLTPASRDQEHIPTILWSDPRIPDRTDAGAGRGGTVPDLLLDGVRGLVAAGCGAIAIPCNTAHGWYPEIVAAAGIPVLHIVTSAITALRQVTAPGTTIGIMGTAGTLAMRLYQDRLDAEGFHPITPDAAEMARLVSPAIALVKANRVAEAYAPLAEMVTMLAGRGATAVVLGCTEIPLGIAAGPFATLPVPLVDTIDALALTAIDWAQS
jgi:aspartate racemase